jgi:hypothetical protein
VAAALGKIEMAAPREELVRTVFSSAFRSYHQNG